MDSGRFDIIIDVQNLEPTTTYKVRQNGYVHSHVPFRTHKYEWYLKKVNDRAGK